MSGQSPPTPGAQLARECRAGVEALVARAGERIMEVYAQADVGARSKADDSPVTRADLLAHEVLQSGLAALTPSVPVLSEEGAHEDAQARQAWPLCWIVDPLDGTREFLARNGEFTVNVALVEGHRPVFGCVGVPARGELFTGLVADGQAQRLDLASGARSALRAGTFDAGSRVRVLASRSHRTAELEQALNALRERFPALEETHAGSALKLVVMAAGDADLYPRLGPCSEWDIAAGDAVLTAAGGSVRDLGGERLRYNKPEGLLNPDFLAVADDASDWVEVRALLSAVAAQMQG